MTHYISPERLTIEHVGTILREKATLVLSEESKRRIERCRKYLDDKISTCREPVYGINTGFGCATFRLIPTILPSFRKTL